MTHFNALALFSLMAALCGTYARADMEKPVLIRGDHFRPVIVLESLPDLVSSDRFDGKYFKIVKGKEDEAILLDDPDSDLTLKAATTYFHLTRARSFWVDKMDSAYVRELPKVTIRLEITNKFSDLGHYQNDKIEPQFNNALSIPNGEPMAGVSIPSWNHEIWFRPRKTILTADLPKSGLGPGSGPLSQYIALLAEPVSSVVTSRLIQITLQQLFYPQTLGTSYGKAILNQIGSLALNALILEGSKRADPLFLEKYYYLDTAMIPEIIYHEFSHIALSDHLALTLSTPILEGMADYFATSVSGSPDIANKIKRYSLAMPKNARDRLLYSSVLEGNIYSNSDFVLSVLYLMKEAFPEISDRLVFLASTFLSTDRSDIRHDLVGALLESCQLICEDPRREALKIREILEEKGF